MPQLPDSTVNPWAAKYSAIHPDAFTSPKPTSGCACILWLSSTTSAACWSTSEQMSFLRPLTAIRLYVQIEEPRGIVYSTPVSPQDTLHRSDDGRIIGPDHKNVLWIPRPRWYSRI